MLSYWADITALYLYTSYSHTKEYYIQPHSQCSLSDLPSPVYQGLSSQELLPYTPPSSLRSLSLTMSRRPLPMYVPLPSVLSQAEVAVEHEGRKEACCWYRDRTGDCRFRQGDCRYVYSSYPFPCFVPLLLFFPPLPCYIGNTADRQPRTSHQPEKSRERQRKLGNPPTRV